MESMDRVKSKVTVASQHHFPPSRSRGQDYRMIIEPSGILCGYPQAVVASLFRSRQAYFYYYYLLTATAAAAAACAAATTTATSLGRSVSQSFTHAHSSVQDTTGSYKRRPVSSCTFCPLVSLATVACFFLQSYTLYYLLFVLLALFLPLLALTYSQRTASH